MTHPSDLVELRERLQKATEPDRDLDGAIAKAFGLPNGPKDCVDMEARAVWTIPEIAQPYTASIDAALSLVERVLPGWGFVLTTTDDGAFYCELCKDNAPGAGPDVVGATLPLAILDAALTALSQLTEK